MKLTHQDLNYQVLFYENTINVLLIENVIMFREFVGELIGQINGGEGKFVLSDNKELNLSKKAKIITDFFTLDLGERKLLTTMYDELRKIAMEEELYQHSTVLISAIEKYFEEIRYFIDYPISYGEVDFNSLFKAVDLKIEEEHESLLEKLIDYVSLTQKLNEFSCIIFVNLKTFLTTEELSKFYQYTCEQKINILLIENHHKDRSLDIEKIFILDQDLCEIY